ncbi:siderophore iron transporter mirB [Penicillium argentinense]|uniref:Siderophore iron transporter mirB n=1 Tax=Penicillium argentinense TaxID=1131581 RepID=A0A9W9KDW7_9EURO|nr:siderophore iron transporter mirB [Penicillium argentinense]KAJ5102915.1 siderophore iron transporter mirB [Penicillium argentinense]
MADHNASQEGEVIKSEMNVNVESGKQHYSDGEDLAHNPDVPDYNAQYGVKSAEAMTLSWSRTSLIVVYMSMWLLYFSNAFEASLSTNLSPYVSSAFNDHSLVTVINVVSQVLTGVTYMPVAKILNLWDRSVGFTIMLTIAVIGMILMASTNSFELYAASNCLYSIGFTGMTFCVDVVTADTSTMRNRGLAFAFTSSPYIITAFGGPKAAETIYADNWRWGFGAWAIVLPVVGAPMITMMVLGKRKAEKNGLAPRQDSGRTWYASVLHYFIEFDDQWNSPSIIAMIIIGFFLLVCFGFWERFGARVPFVPWSLLTDRSVIGACMLDFVYQIAYYCWYNYFSSYLQVVYNQSLAGAGYIGSIYDVVSGVELLIVGALISYTGHYKWVLMWGVPMYILGVGLMIYFRQPGNGIGYIIMCQIFIALGGGVITIGEQVALMASAEHNDVAALLALLGLFGYIGGAIGGTVSGGIWTNVLPGQLRQRLPASKADQWEDILNSLDVQLSYPVGDPTRTAISDAYAATNKYMLIAGVCIMSLGLVCMAIIKDRNVKHIVQTKGLLF